MSGAIVKMYQKMGLDNEINREELLKYSKEHEKFFPAKKKISLDFSANSKKD